MPGPRPASRPAVWRFWLRTLTGWVVLLAAVASAGLAQNYGNYNPRDDQYRLLGMTRAQSE